MFTAQEPKCCVSGTLEGSPRYRGGTVVQFAQVQLVIVNTVEPFIKATPDVRTLTMKIL